MNCSYCGNNVSDISKGCPTCGNRANCSLNYCYNCGRENAEAYKICAGCKTPLVAKQSWLVAMLLSCFLFFPFLAFYAGRKREGLIRTLMFAIGAIAFSYSASIGDNNETIVACIQGITAVTWGTLFVWSCIDILKIFMAFPRHYTNDKGLIIW